MTVLVTIILNWLALPAVLVAFVWAVVEDGFETRMLVILTLALYPTLNLWTISVGGEGRGLFAPYLRRKRLEVCDKADL